VKADWLLIDLGNSRLKWAWLNKGQLGPTTAIDYRHGPLAPQLEATWPKAPARILICSVASDQTSRTLADWCQGRWSLQPQWFSSSASFLGIRNAYKEPARLGNDRWLGLIAARHLVSGPLAVVDCGTAMTIDLLDAQGQHQGGWILPGLGLQQRALYQRTSISEQACPDISLEPGQDSAHCIANGTLLSAVGTLSLIGEHLAKQKQWQGLCWMLTGGEASIIAPHLPWPYRLQPDLLLEGLALVALHLDTHP
jgi:type III pantothenate kinase